VASPCLHLPAGADEGSVMASPLFASTALRLCPGWDLVPKGTLGTLALPFGGLARPSWPALLLGELPRCLQREKIGAKLK